MEASVRNRIRLNFLDEIRGLAVFCMIFYHSFYVCGTFFGQEWANRLFEFFMPVQPWFAGIFIFVCGVSCTLSKNNLKRGLILLGVAVGFTLVTALILPALGFEGTEVYFGILHLLAISVLLYAFAEKKLGRISPFAGIILCAVLFAFTSGISEGRLGYGNLINISLPEGLYDNNYLVPLGIYAPWFYSADYFPIFPNIFIFISGALTGRICAERGYPEWVYPERVEFLGKLGRHSLVIYIVHMPVIFAVSYAIELVINLFNR